MTTKLSNPLYTPEVSTNCKVTVINFTTLSPSGLEDQMLGLVVAKERPDLEEAKNSLVVSNAKMKSELKTIEDKILKLLNECKGSPVDDEDQKLPSALFPDFVDVFANEDATHKKSLGLHNRRAV